MTTTARTRGLLASQPRKQAGTPGPSGFPAAILPSPAPTPSRSPSDATAALDTAAGVRHVFSAGRDFLFLFIALGAVGAAGEFRHGTAVPTFLATPARWRVLVAKLAAHLGLGAIVAAACVAVETAIALPWIDAQGTGVTPWSATVLEPAIGSILSGAAYCSLGVAVGMLVRNQIVALAVTLGWFAVAEAALATFTPAVSRFLPGGLFSGADNPAAHLLPLPIPATAPAAYVAGLTPPAAGPPPPRAIAGPARRCPPRSSQSADGSPTTARPMIGRGSRDAVRST